eukprot:365674-Chlamydomonas_euryale.AAC.7
MQRGNRPVLRVLLELVGQSQGARCVPRGRDSREHKRSRRVPCQAIPRVRSASLQRPRTEWPGAPAPSGPAPPHRVARRPRTEWPGAPAPSGPAPPPRVAQRPRTVWPSVASAHATHASSSRRKPYPGDRCGAAAPPVGPTNSSASPPLACVGPVSAAATPPAAAASRRASA